MGKDFIQTNLVKKIRVLHAIEKILSGDRGFKVNVLLRIQWGMPWNMLNYLLPTINCTLRDFYFGTALGIIPKLINYLIIGVNLKSIAEMLAGHRKVDPLDFLFLIF